MSNQTAFIFIHGAWHGAWCFEKVANILAKQGYLTIANDLPGHGLNAQFPTAYFQRPLLPAEFNTEPSPVAAITLDDYVRQVVATIEQVTALGHKAVLVGHSMAGIILNAVGEKLGYERIDRLIYLCAVMPPSNSPIDAIIERTSQADGKIPSLLLADPIQVGALRIDWNSVDPAYQSLARTALYADMSETDFRAISNFLTPDEPAQPFSALVTISQVMWAFRAHILNVPKTGQFVRLAKQK